MKNLKQYFLMVSALVLMYSGRATTIDVINITTGAYNAPPHAVIPDNATDDTWQVKVPGSSTFQNTVVKPANGTCAKWVYPSSGSDAPGGNGVFRMSFNNTRCYVTSVQIVFNCTNADDAINSMSVNSTLVHTYPAPQPGFSSTFVANTSYTINIPANLIVMGTNYIEFNVYNWSSPGSPMTPFGLAINASVYIASDIVLPNPTITGPNAFCANGAIYFTGSDGLGNTSTSHYWHIIECDALGNPGNPVNSWASSTSNTFPGMFVFPALSFIQCGQYYLVTLYVANSCGYQTVNKIIYINCAPVANAGEDQYLCGAGCTNLTASGSPPRSHTYSWYQQTGDEPIWIGNGTGIQVCPTQTTQYCVTVTSNATGCSTTDCMTVYIDQLDPSFSYSSNTNNNSYFTFSGTPNQVNNFPGGFGYLWVVDELDGSFNTLWSTYGGSCWWNFPAVLTNQFGGYDGPNGVMNSSCSPAPGRFKYNTNYRITRGVWSAHCPWVQSSLIISFAKSGNGQIVVTEDRNAPDYSSLVNQFAQQNEAGGSSNILFPVNSLDIYPNPASGEVNITFNLENNVPGRIVVTDMTGQLVSSMDVLSQQANIRLDLGENPNGIYIVRLEQEGKTIKTSKLVLNR